jgi:uncharacterized protein YecT (DUF1311 family)
MCAFWKSLINASCGLVAALTFAGSAFAQEPAECGPEPFDGQIWQQDIRCDPNGTTLSMSACAALRRDHEECLLGAVVDRLLAKAGASEGQTSGMFGPGYVDSIREAHVAWLAWRNRECALATLFDVGGSIRRVSYPTCQTDMTSVRRARLESLLAVWLSEEEMDHEDRPTAGCILDPTLPDCPKANAPD